MRPSLDPEQQEAKRDNRYFCNQIKPVIGLLLDDDNHAVDGVGQEMLGAAALGSDIQQVGSCGGVQGRQLHQRGRAEAGGGREGEGLDPSGAAL